MRFWCRDMLGYFGTGWCALGMSEFCDVCFTLRVGMDWDFPHRDMLVDVGAGWCAFGMLGFL